MNRIIAVICFAVLAVGTLHAESLALTIDTLDKYWGDCIETGRPLELPPLVLNKSVKVGQIGLPTIARGYMKFKLVQKLSDTEGLVYAHYVHDVPYYPSPGVMLGRLETFENGPFLFRGYDLSAMADDASFEIDEPITIAGTFEYTNVSQAKSTILVVSTVNVPEPPAKASLLGVVERTWKSKDGSFTRNGTFAGYERGTVAIKIGDELVDVKLTQLHAEDHKYVQGRMLIDKGYENKLNPPQDRQRKR